MFNIFNRRPKVITNTVIKQVEVQPDPAKYIKTEEVVRHLFNSYIDQCVDVEPLIGVQDRSKHNDEYVSRALGRMDQIHKTYVALTGVDSIVASFQLDKAAQPAIAEYYAEILNPSK